MLIIGFGSKARQGKDTAAQAIVDFYRDKNLHTQKPVSVGVLKYATFLYQEVNEFLAIEKSFDYSTAELFKMGVREVRGGSLCVDKIPDWVQPDPNPEFSDLAPYGKHPKLLQWWGTDYRREQDTDYWVKKMFADMSVNLDVALITDVRFPNEAQGIKQRGGYNVNVARLHEDGRCYYSSDRSPSHPSETALDNFNWDFRLINSAGHSALLGEQAITLVEYLRGLHEAK